MPSSRRQPVRPPPRAPRARSSVLDAGSARAVQQNAGFPDRMVAKLAYTDFRRISAGAIVALDTVYQLNGAFDPEYSGVGHQPRGYDPLAALYNRYRVNRVFVDLEVRQRAAHGLIGCLVPNNVQTALVAADIPFELHRAVALPMTGSAQPIHRTRVMFDMPSILGQSPAQYAANEDVAAATTGLPNEGIYLHVYLAQTDAVTTLDAEIRINLILETEFFDRKVDAPSSLLRELQELRSRLRDEEDDRASVVVPLPAPRANLDPRRTAGRPG